MNITPSTNNKYYALDALRGIAAIVVVQMHAKWWFNGEYLKSGYLAVDFFFLLSGFVIAHAYGDKLNNKNQIIKFIKIRIIRLYPLFILAIALTFFYISLKGENISIIQILLTLFMLPDLTTPDKKWIVAVSWSLFFEFLINILYAISKNFLSCSKLILISVLGFILLLFCSIKFSSLDVGYAGAHMIGGLARVLYSFPLGVLIYQNKHLFNIKIKHSEIVSSLILFFMLSINAPDTIKPFSDLVIVTIAMPIILIISINSNPSKKTISAMSILGIISYPLYMTHNTIKDIIDILFKTYGLPKVTVYSPFLGSAIIILMCIICVALDKYYDKPIRKWLTKKIINRH